MRNVFSRSRITTFLALAAVVFAAAALRWCLLSGPQTELEADEAIVGLMGRHILDGERPVFYYMQPYLGSLEAYLVAGSFALLGSSTLALKLVPFLLSLLFVGLVFATGYRLAGLPAAVVSGLYVAIPPAFFALWSLKARGGYIETLVIGQLLILLAIDIGKRGRIDSLRGVALGFLTGFGIWTNPLVAVYLVPIAVYLLLVLRAKSFGLWLVPGVASAIVGAYPLLEYNLTHGFETASAMLGGAGSLSEAVTYCYRFFRYSLPILAGLAQASSSDLFFWPAFRASAAGSPPVAAVAAILFIALAMSQTGRLVALFRGRLEGKDGRVLLALLLVVVPLAFVLSKFRELVTEPRYLLPLYSAAPLLGAGLVAQWQRWRRWLVCLTLAGLLGLNVYSIESLDPVLNLPDTAIGSTAANRAELTEFLLSHGLNRVYADYWIAYPLAFESRERVVTSVISGGFNRYTPYAYLVSVATDPAFVFVDGSREEVAALARWQERGVDVTGERVSIYKVYWQAKPLNRARP